MFWYTPTRLMLLLSICFEYSHNLPCTTAHPIHESEGRRCSTPAGGDGVCRRLPSCPAVAHAISVGTREHKRCGFIGRVEIVCCSPPSFQDVMPPTVSSSHIPLPVTESLSTNAFMSPSLLDSDFVATPEIYEVQFSSTSTPDDNERKYNTNINDQILDNVHENPYTYSSVNSFTSGENNVRQEKDIKASEKNHNDTHVYTTPPSYVTLRNWPFKISNLTNVTPTSVSSSPTTSYTHHPFTAQYETQGSTYPSRHSTASNSVGNAQHSTTELEASITTPAFDHSEGTPKEDNSWLTRDKMVAGEGYIVRPTQLSLDLPIYSNHSDLQSTNPSYNSSHTFGNLSSNLSNRRPTTASSTHQHNNVDHSETLPSKGTDEISFNNHQLSTEPTQILSFKRDWQTTPVLPTKTHYSDNNFPSVTSSSNVADTTFDSLPLKSDYEQFSKSSVSTYVSHEINSSEKSKIRRVDPETVQKHIVSEGPSKQRKHEESEIGLRPSLDIESNEILSLETNLPKIQTTTPTATTEEHNNYNLKEQSSPLPDHLLKETSRENMKNEHVMHLDDIPHSHKNTDPNEFFHTTHIPRNTMIDMIHNSYWSTRESTTQTSLVSEHSWTQATTEQNDQSKYRPSEKNKTSVTEESTISGLFPDNINISQSIGRSQEACAKYKKIPKLTKYIIGGDYAEHGEFPHMVALGFQKPRRANLSWLCGGTLLNEEFVLTAAHCVLSVYGPPLVARVGFTSLSGDGATGREVGVRAAVAHPAFDARARFADVALLRLAARVPLSPFALPACLRRDAAAPPGALVVTGWGSVTPDGSTPTNHLKKAVVEAVDDDACRKSYPDLFRPEMICAGSEDVVDSCKGDSGGPLQLLEDPGSAVYTVVGVTSFGPNPCAGARPGVYTRVASFVPWIESVVWGDGAEAAAGP